MTSCSFYSHRPASATQRGGGAARWHVGLPELLSANLTPMYVDPKVTSTISMKHMSVKNLACYVLTPSPVPVRWEGLLSLRPDSMSGKCGGPAMQPERR